MIAAAWPRERRLDTRLLVVDPETATVEDRRFDELPSVLHAGDLLVVNDAATLPASLAGTTDEGPVEVRLARRGATSREWTAVLFGAGDWRRRTEDRPPPPVLVAGDPIRFGEGLAARVERVPDLSPRLVDIQFNRDGPELWSALYRVGRPIQYSYLCGPLSLGQVQTDFAGAPASVEMPSAGRPLSVALLCELRRRGVEVAAVTHEAGLSATGDPALDTALPFPERYVIPLHAALAVANARKAGRRVLAVGTTVVRALEGSALSHGGEVRPGTGLTDLRISGGFELAVADGLLTGVHDPETSHFSLLRAFAPEPLLRAAHRHAERRGYLGHEFGDACLILGSAGRRPGLRGSARSPVKRAAS